HPDFPGSEIPEATIFQPVVSFPDDLPRNHPIPWLFDETFAPSPSADFCLCGNPADELFRAVERVASSCGSLLRADPENPATTIAQARLTLCVWNGGSLDCAFYQALALGRIPILISDARRLPFDDLIDYSTIAFHIGIASEELALIPSILQTDQTTLNAMVTQGREIHRRFLSLTALPAQIVRILATRHPSASEPPRAPHEFPLTDTAGHLLDEPRMFAHLWRQLAHTYPADGTKGLLFLGAGKFLHRFLDAGDPWKNQTNIRGIADDAAQSGQTFAGYPLAPPDAFPAHTFNSVFLATDSCEKKLAERCRALFDPETPTLSPAQLAAKSPGECSPPPRTTQPPSHGRKSSGRFMRRLEGLLVCIRYGDYLSWSLPGNLPHFDRLVVVTSPDDTLSRSIAAQHGATVILSDSYVQDGAVFNKGKLLNEGFKALKLDDWVLVCDSDILLPIGLRRRLQQRFFNPECLYYAIRLEAPIHHTEHWLTAFESNPALRSSRPFNRPGANRMPWGYFQLFHARECPPSESGEPFYSEHFPNAGDVDYEFQARWPAERKILLPEAVVHLPHGGEGVNWTGRTSRRLKPRPVSCYPPSNSNTPGVPRP
ncbi:MAG: hypothetical protein PHG65_12620, partial [Kiritimatiellae bacterium]|nr:hypothetical protein [Kiritimatiellia bacterium]